MKKSSSLFVLAIVASVFLISVRSTYADAPIAQNDTGILSEGGSLNIIAPGVLLNDSDPEGGGLTVSTQPVSGPSHGSLTLNGDGSYFYAHNGTETTTDSFVYEVCDTEPLCSQATVMLTIVAVNDAPIPQPDTATVAEGGNVAASAPGVLANDSDEEGDQLTVTTTPVNGPSHGSLSLAPDGSYSYTHDGSETTADSFVYQVCDNGVPSLCAEGTVNISINPVNDPPQAEADSATLFEGASITVPAPGILDNDSDPDIGNSIEVDPITPTSPPRHGTLTMTVNGSFTYTHNGSETTSDSFTYRVCDSGTPKLCDQATVTLTIDPVNDAPIPMDDTLTVDEGATATVEAPGVLGNDTDAENNALSVSTTPISGPTYGSVTLEANGSYTYEHGGSEMDSDSFVYQVCDDGDPFECAQATVHVTVTAVNDAPLVDLNGPMPGTGNIIPFAVNGGPINITTNSIDILDADDINMESATVNLVNFPDGASEMLSTDTTGTSIVASYDALQGTLTLQGSDSIANYERVLRNVRYDNILQTPDTTTRNINVVVHDGDVSSNIATAVVNIVDSKIEIDIAPQEQDVSAGDTAMFTVVISNTGNVELTNINISNSFVSDCDRTLDPIAAGRTISYSCEYPNVTATFVNQATVTSRDPLNDMVSASDSAVVNLSSPTLAVIITPNLQEVPYEGTASFTIGILNLSPDIDLTNMVATATNAPGCDRNIGTLDASSNTGYTCQLSDVTSETIVVVTVAATNADNGTPISSSDSAEVQVFDMALQLTATPETLRTPGGIVQYSATVINHSTTRELTLSSLQSTPFGDLTDSENPMLENANCAAGVTIGIRGDSYTCAFEVNIMGQAGIYDAEVTAVTEDVDSRLLEKTATISVQMFQNIYMPLIPLERRLDEPNDTVCQAYPIMQNVTHEFQANDVNDWYRFELTETSDVSIDLTNFVNESGQLWFWTGSCQNPTLISFTNITDSSLSVDVGSRDAGIYYILVLNFGAANHDDLYQLRVNVSPN